MSEMVKRGEAALRKELQRQADEGELYYRDGDGMVDGRVDRTALVRAIIAAIREPTEAMRLAAAIEVGISPGQADHAWRVMNAAMLD